MAVASTAWLSVKMLYDEGELERAELAAIDGIDRVASVNPWFVHALWLQLALIRAARGNIGGAMQAGRTSVELRDAYSMYSDWSVLSKDALMALLYLRSGDVRSARYWIDRADLALDNLAFTEERDAVVFGQVLSAEGEARRASRLLDRLAVRARDGGRYRCFLEARVAGALAVVRGDEGEHERAVELLVEALEVAAPHGFVTLFVDSAAPMEDLLKSAAQVRRVRPYARMLLSRMATSPERPFVITMDRASRMVDPGEPFEALTHRETEVLALLAMGYSNKEVADLMSLSPHTIKAHTRNIYGKLGVNSRVQAIVRAKELRLLTG